jgi:hypothetical protein
VNIAHASSSTAITGRIWHLDVGNDRLQLLHRLGAGEGAGSIGQSGGLTFHACQAFLSRANLGLLRPHRSASATTASIVTMA